MVERSHHEAWEEVLVAQTTWVFTPALNSSVLTEFGKCKLSSGPFVPTLLFTVSPSPSTYAHIFFPHILFSPPERRLGDT